MASRPLWAEMRMAGPVLMMGILLFAALLIFLALCLKRLKKHYTNSRGSVNEVGQREPVSDHSSYCSVRRWNVV